jgi:hypothetical protein
MMGILPMENTVIVTIFVLFVFAAGFILGRLSRRNKIEDLEQEVAELFREDQAHQMQIAELEVKLSKKEREEPIVKPLPPKKHFSGDKLFN